VAVFKLDPVDFEERHQQAFGAYEEGRLTLDSYLDCTVFREKRSFSRARFRTFMYGQSTAEAGMLPLLADLKRRHGLKVVVVSDEGRELNAHRVRAFKLDALADVFVSSSFVGLRKPDPTLYRLAMDLAQRPADQIVYLENTPMFLEAARKMGIRGILHRDLESTRAGLRALGLA
jgi:putative hydrolase of the HAD superfamily